MSPSTFLLGASLILVFAPIAMAVMMRRETQKSKRVTAAYNEIVDQVDAGDMSSTEALAILTKAEKG